MDQVVEHLQTTVRPGDLVITLGAGNIWQVGEAFVDRYRLQIASDESDL
jgi:UDP-N-acetylmuramate--alanine ligase